LQKSDNHRLAQAASRKARADAYTGTTDLNAAFPKLN
jgi:hypothetical protein